MKFDQLYSSSTANLYTVTVRNGKRLLIECGVPWQKLIAAIGFKTDDIEACLLSHEHKDHSKAALDVMKAGIDLYGSLGTLTALNLVTERRAKPTAPQWITKLQSFDFFTFGTNHDAAEPFGYLIREVETKELLLFATDTSHLAHRFKHKPSIIAIECSYDKEVLQARVDAQDINEELAKRLLTSHMEKRNALKYLEDYCNLSKCREIHLLHMSADNIGNKESVRAEFEKKLFIETKIVQRKVAAR